VLITVSPSNFKQISLGNDMWNSIEANIAHAEKTHNTMSTVAAHRTNY